MKTLTFNISAKIILFTLASTLLFSSCKNDDDEVVIDGNAKFKLINAVQGSSAQDFYQGDTKINTTALAYGDISESLTVKAGVSTVSFKEAGTQNTSASVLVGVNSDLDHTVFYGKSSTGGGIILAYADVTSSAPAGKAGVRFVNLGAQLLNPVVVSFGTGQAITNPLTFGNMTGYAVIDTTAELKFSLIDAPNSSTAIPAATFQSGKLYTVWFDAANTTTAQYHIIAQD